MNKNSLKETYRAERGRVITTLHNSMKRLSESLDFSVKYGFQPNKENAMFLQAYTTAANTLLQLMKEEIKEIEESEETSHE